MADMYSFDMRIGRRVGNVIMEGLELPGPAAGRLANDEVVHQHGGRERLGLSQDTSAQRRVLRQHANGQGPEDHAPHVIFDF